MCTVPSWCAHSPVAGHTPWLVPVVSVSSKKRCGQSQVNAHSLWCMRTLPSLCAHCQEGWVAGWRGDWSCCYRGIPKVPPRVFFFLGKSSCKSWGSIQGRACPLTQPTSPARLGTVHVRAPHAPTLNSPLLVPMVSLCLPHLVLIPLPATSSNQVSLSAAQTLFGRGGSC